MDWGAAAAAAEPQSEAQCSAGRKCQLYLLSRYASNETKHEATQRQTLGRQTLRQRQRQIQDAEMQMQNATLEDLSR
jgi:hypothetical protein